VVTITKGGELYLNEKQVNVRLLAQELRQRFPNQKAVYLRGDRNTIWDPIAQVISVLGEAGFTVNVVTQPEDSASK
jgi:biopolymer transport protein ExbD